MKRPWWSNELSKEGLSCWTEVNGQICRQKPNQAVCVGFVYMMSLDFILIAMRRHSGDLIEDWHDCIYILKSFLWLACGKWAKWKPMMAPGKQVRRRLTIFQVREDGKEPGGQCSIEMVRLGINVRSTATRSFWWLGPWEMTD